MRARKAEKRQRGSFADLYGPSLRHLRERRTPTAEESKHPKGVIKTPAGWGYAG